MINRIKLEHILEYARQQRHIGQHCKIPPGDMVEIMEIAMRKAGNSPVTPDGWIR
ncbi:valyl-tRNA synthetase, partial [Escherichia coli]